MTATLVAYLDGELRPAAMARVEAALPVEPQLQQRVEHLRAVDAALEAAFDPMLEAPLPALALTERPPAGRGASPVAATANWLGGGGRRGRADHRVRGRSVQAVDPA